ncbi:MAG: uroporphyrinogen-III C-methyltransferase [Armatimonadetes bacterium]|nr:uroporphyrinogen-III C-methyltransferase [Armatimonadota bacterium]MDW8027516.1 uroporphyrinogen-III C-methyltransferase [Armatimonadota bacterium]
MTNSLRTCGFVCIVGAGPGDAGLLTLKAKSYLEQADVIIYDRLVTDSILAFARPDAELIYAGKGFNGEGVSQDWVNEVMISKALEGKFVVRLKNGDPFVFGRGAEEVEALVDAGIPFEIVPGVSSTFAVPAYAGIPLTDRRFSSSFVVTVGRNSPLSGNGQRASIKELAKADTVIVLMGVGEIERVVQKLLEGGKTNQTPAAIIEWGTTSRQKVVTTTLGELVSVTKAQNIQPPAVLVVGDVVKLRRKLAWYERKPLFGKRISLTCVDEQDQKLAHWLEELGAEVIRLPFLFKKFGNSLVAKLSFDKDTLRDFNWLIFACPHSVDAFFELAREKGFDLRAFAQTKFAAFGKHAAKALSEFCIFPEIVFNGREFAKLNAISFTKGANGQRMENLRFLICHGCQTLSELSEQLKKLGAKVEEIEWSENETISDKFIKTLLSQPIDIFVFTHPCVVKKFAKAKMFGKLNLKVKNFAAIGEDTSQALCQVGLVSGFGLEIQELKNPFEPSYRIE